MLLQTAIFGGLVAFAITLRMQRMLGPFATRVGLLDHPNARKTHAAPTPITGGLCMFAAALAAGILLFGELGPASVGISLSAIILVVLGVCDDKYDLRWWLRLAVQVIAVLVMIYIGGIRVEQLGDVFGSGITSLGVLSVPFTVFAAVGIINAVNMIDGIDGLAGSLTLCALLMLEAAALYTGNDAVYLRVPLLIGAVSGFLFYNLRLPWQPRARIFMGSAGSWFLGLMIAGFAFRLTQMPEHPVSPVLALWLLPVPVMDCLVLMIRRTRNKRSPFAADRNHIHHLMLEGGFGPTLTVCILAFLSCAGGLIVGIALRMHVPRPPLMIAFVCLCVFWYWITSKRDRAVGIFRRLHGMDFGFQYPLEPKRNV